MAGEELQVVRLRDDFYRDGFYRVIVALAIIIIAIIFLISVAVYLYLDKPKPIGFATDNEWRILKPVPLNEIYITTPDLIQWVSEVTPQMFTFDFLHYDNQMKALQFYFTENGWKKYLSVIKNYANINTMETTKQFISTNPAGAPFILNQGLLEGRYGWWIQIPLELTYITLDKSVGVTLTLQVLVVRVSTLNNLYGVAIDNLNIITKGGAGSQQ